MRIISRDIEYSGCDPFTNGEYELFNFIKDKVRVFFDVGVRTDTYYMENSSNIYFHLFEPHQKYYEELKNKIANINCKCKINNFGLGNKKHIVTYYEDTGSIVKRKFHIESKSDPINVEIDLLDNYCQENGINEIDFIKIDTEGYELNVLLGGPNMILNHTKFVQFEYGGCFLDMDIRLKDIYDFFGKEWQIYNIQQGHLNLQPQPVGLYENGNINPSERRMTNYLAAKHPI